MANKKKYNIKINLQTTYPSDFKLSMDEFDRYTDGYSFKRPETEININFPFNKNINEWEIEVLYEGPSCIVGRLYIKTKNGELYTPISLTEVRGELTNMMIGEFIIAKHIQNRLNIRFLLNCTNNLSQKHLDFLEKQFSEIRDQIRERLRFEEYKRNKLGNV